MRRGGLLLALVGVLAAAEADSPAYSTSWIGNDLPYSDGLFASGSSSHDRREQACFPQAVHGLAVRADGLCAVTCRWGEVGVWGGLARGGDWIATFNAWGSRGDHSGAAVAIGSRYAYVAWGQSHFDDWKKRKNGNGVALVPPPGQHFWGVRRFSLNGQVAPWVGSNGGGFDGSMLWIAETETRNGQDDPAAHPVRGLAIDAHDRLYLADAEAKRIVTIDGLTMAVRGERALAYAPGHLACDGRGGLWITDLLGTRLLLGSDNDTNSDKAIPLPENANVTALGWNPARGEMLATLGAPQHQILRLRLDGTLAGRVGESLLAVAKDSEKNDGKAGAEGPLRFAGLTGVGADASGRIYTSEDFHGARLRCHDNTGRERWALRGLEFCDLAAPDPAEDRDVYTRDTHYRLDYTKPAGQQWSVVGHILDPERYPADSRLGLTFGSTVRVGPHLLRTSHGMGPAGGFGLARQHAAEGEGEIFVPVALFTFGNTKTLWTDRNGDGQPNADETAPLAMHNGANAVWMDSQGTVWLVGQHGPLSRIAIERWDERGVPHFAAPEAVALPELFTQVSRAHYLPERDAMVLNGFTAEAPYPDHHSPTGNWGIYKILGPVIARYDDWSKPTRRLTWQIRTAALASNWNSEYSHSLAIAGDHLFTCGNGMGSASPWIRAYDLATGREDTADDRRILPFGRSDYAIIFDCTYSLAAHRRTDGEYLLFAEEDGHAKQWMFRWRPGRTAPPAPGGFTTHTSSNGRGVHLAWQIAAGAADYRIERGLLGPDGWGPWTIAADRLVATTWDDAAVPPAGSARYRVRARSAAGSFGSESVERYARTLAWEGEHVAQAGLVTLPPGATAVTWSGSYLSGPGLPAGNPPNNHALLVTPASAGQILTITLPNIPAGRWRVVAQFACAANLGRVRLAVASGVAIEENLGVVVDGPYASVLAARPQRELPVTLATAGPVVLHLTVLDATAVILDCVRLEAVP